MLKRFLPLLAPEGAVAATPEIDIATGLPAETPPAGDAKPAGDAAAAAAAAAEKAKKQPEPDPKKLAAFAADFLGREKPKPETEEEKKAREAKEAAAAAAGKPAAAAKPKKPKPAPPVARREPPAPSLTTEQIAEAAAKGVASAMGKPAAKTVERGTELPATEQRKVGVLEHMETLYPDKYKGIAEQYKTSLVELQTYADNWEKAHPGETFDEDADEHAAFFTKHDVNWDDDDYTEAVADIRTGKALAEERKKTDAELKDLKQAEKLRTEAPKITLHQVTGAKVFWKGVSDELAKVINEDGSVNVPLLTEMQKKDPIGTPLRVAAASDLNLEVAELYKVMSGLSPYDEKNPIHQNIGKFAMDMEREILNRPEDQRLDQQGRSFMPAAEYYKLPKERREQYHWVFSAAELSALRAHYLATDTEKRVAAEHKRQREVALAMGWTPPPGSENGSPAASSRAAAAAAATEEKPDSPGGAADSKLAAGRSGAGAQSPDGLSAFAKKFLGKS